MSFETVSLLLSWMEMGAGSISSPADTYSTAKQWPNSSPESCWSLCLSFSCSHRRGFVALTVDDAQRPLGITKPSASTRSYAAHFGEVTWQPEIARLRLSRIVATVDAGRIINERIGVRRGTPKEPAAQMPRPGIGG
jgi:hypothetical protein